MKLKKMKLTVIFKFIIICISIITLFLYLTILTETINKLITFKNNNISVKYSSINYI